MKLNTLAFVTLLASGSAFAADTKAPAKPAVAAKPAGAPTAKAQVLKFEAKEENGKKIWLPLTSTAKVGEPVTLEIHNSLTAPHGFKIDGYVEPQVIGANETKTVTFTPAKKGALKVECHLHPPHVGATINVQ